MGSIDGIPYASPELYDIMYGDAVEDVAFYVARARAAGGPVLEVACGNGRVLVPTRAAGVDIEGLDLDPAMLGDARRKLAARGLEATLHLGDMRDFALPRRFALVTIPFNAFLHNATAADQIATLRCCRAHLAPGGALVLNIFHPDARKLVEHDGTLRPVKEVPLASGAGRARIADATRADPVSQTLEAQRRVEILDASGAVVETHGTSFTLRYVYRHEMELLFRHAGFERCELQAGFAAKPRLEEGDVMVWTAWRDAA